MGIRLNLFFAQFLFIISVSTEQSQICVTNTVLVKQERRDPCWQDDPLFVPTSSLMKTPTPSTDDPAQEDLFQKYKERLEKVSQQNRVIKICTDAGFLTTVEFGQYFMTKDADEFSQFTEPVTCREHIFAKRWKNQLTRKVEFEGTPKLARVWSHNQLFER